MLKKIINFLLILFLSLSFVVSIYVFAFELSNLLFFSSVGILGFFFFLFFGYNARYFESKIERWNWLNMPIYPNTKDKRIKLFRVAGYVAALIALILLSLQVILL